MAKTEKKCVICPNIFTGNAHKTTCSPACRTKLSRMKSKGDQPKKEEPKPAVKVTDLNEKSVYVKPITAPLPKTNYTVNTTATKPKKNSLSDILKGMGYAPATEPKKFIPPVLQKKATD